MTTAPGGAALSATRHGLVERRLMRDGAIAASGIGAVISAVAGMTAGVAGALSAAVGAACVLVLFVVSAAALAWAAPRGPRMVGKAVAVGAGVRLIGYAAALTLLVAAGTALHEVSLAVGIVATFTGTLMIEMRTLMRSPEALWIDVGSTTTGAGNR